MISKSKGSINSWLEAISRGRTPLGTQVEMVQVNEGEVKTIHVCGGQHFGSGGYSAGSLYAGEEPELVVGSDRRSSTSFINDLHADFRFKSPSVVYISSGDCIGNGRDFERKVYVCATAEQVTAALSGVPSVVEPEELPTEEVDTTA
ncbi:MAG: hypothetical protein CEN90_160 [Parcubacteria group bacterium Licking1014_17]|nr:MAG: hypothetical protein CEN90_160 [Parcubacteria group bacterium Licking1014_17]